MQIQQPPITGNPELDIWLQRLTEQLSGYINLHGTDTDGTNERDIWYDNSEDKLKFKTSTGVETITSA